MSEVTKVFIYVYETCVNLCLPASLDSLAYESTLLVTLDIVERSPLTVS